MLKANIKIAVDLKSILLCSFILFSTFYCFSQTIPKDSLYLSQTPPGNTPKIFPLSVKPGYFAAERIVITKNGKDIYYSEILNYYPERGLSVKQYSFKDGKWRGPFVVFEGYAAPALSITEDTMYVECNFKSYMSVKKNNTWTTPKQVFLGLDSVHYYQRTDSGNYYMSTRSGMGVGMADWCKVTINGKDTSALSFGRPLNTGGDNLDYFIAADESYMIVTNRPRFGICYKKSDGGWTSPKSFGPVIDFGIACWGPYVSDDKKYLFFTTGTKMDYSDVHIYWVRIDGLIDSFKNTNQIPYVKNLIGNKILSAGQSLNFTVPDNIFFDDDNKNLPLTFSATLLDGSPLPEWLIFNSQTRTFSGTPSKVGELIVKVVVEDNEKATAFCPFKIIITD